MYDMSKSVKMLAVVWKERRSLKASTAWSERMHYTEQKQCCTDYDAAFATDDEREKVQSISLLHEKSPFDEHHDRKQN